MSTEGDAMQTTQHQPWRIASVHHEGAPLLLRVRVGADTPGRRAEFGRLAIIVQSLDRVRPDGLPEPDYNDALADFDAHVIEAVEESARGLVALVETFQGERTYYAYAAAGGHSNRVVAELAGRYPQHRLRAFGGLDPDWNLWNDYRTRWPW